MDIGNKIKQLRIKNALTLEELASRSELTKGFLSQLERDLTSPSVATLNDILEALGTSLADFFSDAMDEKLVFKEEDFFVDEQEACTIHWIVPNAQKNEMEPILLELKEQGVSSTIDPHEGEEFGYVIQGKIILMNGDQKLAVKKGETFYITGRYPHYLKNDGKTIAKILWITTPPVF